MFEKTLDDLMEAYLRWSLKPEDRGKGSDHADSNFNVTKTLRRMEALADWGWENKASVMEPPMEIGQLEEFYPRLGTCISTFTSDGSPLWCFSFKMMDVADLKKDTAKQDLLIRNHWYLMHKMAFFPSTQDIGVTMVMDIGHAGVFESMGIMPAKVKAKCDKLMQGASAIKMIKFCMCRPSFWMKAMMKFFKLFMSKKMQSRMLSVGDDFGKLYKHVGGADNVPSCLGFPGAVGTNEDRAFNGKVFHTTPAVVDGATATSSAADAEADSAEAAEALEAATAAAAAAEAAAKKAKPAKVVAL